MVIGSAIFLITSYKRVYERKETIKKSEQAFISKKNEKYVDVYGNKEVGFIEIEKLNVLLPIFDNTSEKSLKEGVGILEGTDFPLREKNSISVIAGHRGGYNGEQTFLNINKLEKGDLIGIVTKNDRLVYEVNHKEIISPYDWSKFKKSDDSAQIVLMTCHPYPLSRERMLVFAHLVE